MNIGLPHLIWKEKIQFVPFDKGFKQSRINTSFNLCFFLSNACRGNKESVYDFEGLNQSLWKVQDQNVTPCVI